MVSIHAPAWGATPLTLRHGQAERVSIHAPAWGATTPDDKTGDLCKKFQSTRPRGARRCWRIQEDVTWPGFNPRARVGRDHREHPDIRPGRYVSIHAPAWGATVIVRPPPLRHLQFQSTRPRGARQGAGCDQQRSARFQSTRPRGARPYVLDLGGWLRQRFNPRARVGRDALSGLPISASLPFQSTRPRGARRPVAGCI